MNSLRSRLLLAAGAMLLVFVLVTAIALDRADHERAEQAVQDRLQGLVYSVLSAVEVSSNGNIEISDTSLPDIRFTEFDSGLGASVAETDGSILWRSTSVLRDPVIPVALPTGVWRLQPASAKSQYFSLALGVSWLLDKSERRFTVLVFEDAHTFHTQRAKFRRTLWLWLGTAAILLLAILLSILFWGLAPVRALTREIEKLQSGELDAISQQYPDELQPLGHALNSLISNERLRQSRYRLALDDLAHSLKTPLAVLQAEIGENPECRTPLLTMQQQIDYHLKRALAGSGRTFGLHTDLAPVIEQVVAALSKVYADRKIRFDLTIDKELQLPVERGDIMEIIGNLLDNACKWCKQRVAVTAKLDGQQICLIIEDDGPGFPDNAAQLLDRGIRADLQMEGQGIGLALVADIVQSLQGTMKLQRSSSLGGGAVHLSLIAA